MHHRLKSTAFFLILASLIFSNAALAESNSKFVEPGRFGLITASTDDGVQFGTVYEGDKFEAAFQFDTGWSPVTSKSANQNGITGDLGLTGRVGLRNNLGDFNYLSYGVQYHDVPWAKDDGLPLGNQFDVGPYIGLQRNFPSSPIMLSVWLLPYAYQVQHSNDGTGNQFETTSHHIFQEGGFGLVYLF